MTTGRINQVTILSPAVRPAPLGPAAPGARGSLRGGERLHAGGRTRRVANRPGTSAFRVGGGGDPSLPERRRGSPGARGGERLHQGGRSGHSATTFWPPPSFPQGRSAAGAGRLPSVGRRARAADDVWALRRGVPVRRVTRFPPLMVGGDPG